MDDKRLQVLRQVLPYGVAETIWEMVEYEESKFNKAFQVVLRRASLYATGLSWIYLDRNTWDWAMKAGYSWRGETVESYLEWAKQKHSGQRGVFTYVHERKEAMKAYCVALDIMKIQRDPRLDKVLKTDQRTGFSIFYDKYKTKLDW